MKIQLDCLGGGYMGRIFLKTTKIGTGKEELFEILKETIAENGIAMEESTLEDVYRTAINSNIKALHYKDIMRSIEHILSFMARDYKIENLHCLKVDMSSFGEESLNLSKKYIDLYGNGNVIQSSNASDVVEKSNLINDINRMVSVYGLSVKEVMTELPILLILMTFTPIMQR